MPFDAVSTPPFPLAGEIASLGASLTWAVSISIFRGRGANVSAMGIGLFKNGLASLCMAVAVFAAWALASSAGTWRPPETGAALWLALSGFIGLALGDTAFLIALKRLGAVATAASQLLVPPATVLLAWLALGETLTRGETIGISLTTAAIIGVAASHGRHVPNRTSLSRRELALGVAMAIASVVAQAVTLVIMRFSLQGMDVATGTLIRAATASAVIFVVLATQGQIKATLRPLLARRVILPLGCAALLGTFVGLLLMSAGAKYAKAGVTSVLTSTYPLWIIPIAAIFLGERTSRRAIGCVLVALAGIAVLSFMAEPS